MRDKEISEGLGDMAHMAEKDHEVQMARADLYKIAKYSIKLHEMLKSVSEAEGLEGWVQSKITKAADYLGSVYHHLDYEQATGELGESTNDCDKTCPKSCPDCGGTGDPAKFKAMKTEARDTHCSDKCCGSDVKAEDCTCPPDCPHCNCNAKNIDEGKFKSAAHRKAVHAAKASGKKKKKGLGERLADKLAEKKDSAGIEYMKKAGNAKADAEAKERSKKKKQLTKEV